MLVVVFTVCLSGWRRCTNLSLPRSRYDEHAGVSPGPAPAPLLHALHQPEAGGQQRSSHGPLIVILAELSSTQHLLTPLCTFRVNMAQQLQSSTTLRAQFASTKASLKSTCAARVELISTLHNSDEFHSYKQYIYVLA
jgi:hypothetical protein